MPSEKSLSHEQPTTSRSTEQSETIEELTSSFSSLSNVSPSVSNSSRGAAASAASLTPPIAQGNHKLKRGPRIANQTRINKWLEFMQLDEIERPSNVCQRLSCQNLTPVECVNKQQVLNDWLQSTAQSKHLPTPPKAASAPLGDLVEPPADAAAIPLTAIPVVRTLSNSNANIPRFNIDHNRNTFKKPQMAAPLSAAEKRLQERRMRREQRSPATFLARPNLAAHDDDDASFFQELLDSLAKNKQKSDNEMPFDLQCKPERSEDELCPRQQSVNAEASQATSGDSEVKQSFNLEPSQATSAVDVDSELELLPTQQSFSLQASQSTSVVDSEVALRASCQSFNLAVSLTKQTDSLASIKRWDLITERRQRQRLNRSLQSDTMLEMLSLPSQQLPASSTQLTPTVLSFMDPGGVYSSQALSLADTGNESLSSDQTVFRPQETLSTKRSQLTWDCASSQITANNAISSKAQQTGLATPATACEFADSQSVHSLPPLEMDATQESQESMFVLEKRNDDTFLPDRGAALAAQRPDKMFAKGNAQRLNVEVDLKFMPPSVQKLYTLICGKFSDYAFVYALSAQLSQDCVPMECYVYLKMALLISLVSIELDELRPPISLCVICNDSCATNRLLNSVGQLAPRFIGPHEGGQLATFSALPARYNWLQASPLMMAQQGVYYAGDWNRLSRPQAEELEKVIENNTLTVPQLPQSELPLETAIWTYWQPEKAVNQTTAFAKLCPIFGLPIYVDEPIVNSSLWNFVLHAHSRDAPKGPDTIRICSEDMRTLLELIQQRQVVFTEPAEQLLKRYYVISRVRQSTAFSSKTYIVLKQFAESVAKLAMRLDVLESDVVVAIFHCENFVRNIFGAGDLPPPPVASFNVISRVDAYMNIFTRWLFQYLDNYEQKLNQ